EYARNNTRTALRIVHDGGDKPREVSATFAELSERSTRVASWLHGRGVEKGDRILVMLPNTLPLWELMLGAMKLGAVIIPATAQPKLVLHTQQSYPVGHFSTMYWIGMREGDVHENISSPGWAKHAWSSFFAPWNAGATILVHDAPRFNAARTLALLREQSVAT